MLRQGLFKYIRANSYNILVFCVVLIVIIISLQHLTTWPRIFYDEGITIEIARNFQLFGVLDISTAPGQFTDVPYITGSNGFPVTLPLALFFKLFGFGLFQARIYALVWLTVFFAVFYLFTKRFWGSANALSAVLLIATFAPVYDMGRRVLGEIPGFIFLLAGLFFLMARQKDITKYPYTGVAAGLFFGLAMISKPSIYLLVAPALILAAILINYDLRKKIIPILIGILPSIILWIFFAFPNPFSIETWKEILLFYQNPAASASLLQNFSRNISLFLYHTTLIYFSLLSIFIIYVLIALRRPIRTDLFLSFLIPYGILLLIYFLKSPGWFKYLIPLQLFILMIFPAHLELALAKLNKTRYYRAIIMGLVLIQGIQLLFFSNITKATSEPEDVANYLNERSGMVGILNSPHIAGLIPPERKLHYITQNEQVIIGDNPLDLPQAGLPKFLVMPADFENSRPFSEKQKMNFNNYKLIRSGKWNVFELQ